MSSSPDSPPRTTPLATRTRPRAPTVQLESPKAEGHLDRYMVPRVMSSKEYAERRLSSITRKPTPIAAKTLKFLVEACEDFIEEETKPNKDDAELIRLKIEIRNYELAFSEHTWLKVEPCSTMNDMEQALLDLKKYEFCASYGDHCAMVANDIRSASEIFDTPGEELISAKQQWTVIGADLAAEAPLFATFSGPNPDSVKTTLAVHWAARHTGLNFENTVQALINYAQRKTTLHRSLKEMVISNEFYTVARMFHDDLLELPSIIPPAISDQEMHIRIIIKTLRDEWFDMSINPNEPGSWSAKPALIAASDNWRVSGDPAAELLRQKYEEAKAADKAEREQEDEEF